MTIFSRLAEFAREPLEAIGAALSDVPASLSHERHRIAITGLQRSGKTVFMTSFAHALLNAASAPQKDFPFFPWRNELQGVTVEDIPGIPTFPYQEYLGYLLSPSPKWPKPTTSLAGLRVRIRHNPTGFIAKQITSTAILDLDLIDYPGEWLLDLPMLSQTFEEWSVQTEELARVGRRAGLSDAWLAEAANIDLDAPEDAEALARIGRGVRRVKISMSDKRQALMDLAKLRRMLPADRHDHSGSIGFSSGLSTKLISKACRPKNTSSCARFC